MSIARTKTNTRAGRKNGKKAPSSKAENAARGGWADWLHSLEKLSSSRIIVLLCLLTSIAYANSLGGEFVFDDIEQIVQNPDIRSWSNLSNAFSSHVWQFRERQEALRVPVPPPYFRPVFTVMLTLEYQTFGLWPQGWHLISLALHILCCIGVFHVIHLLSGRQTTAAITAALFAVYPVHAESVSWISGMTDPLFALFLLASFYLYLRFRVEDRNAFLGSSLVMFALSVYSKETALSLVPLIFVYELIEYRYDANRRNLPTASALTKALTRPASRALPYLGIAILYVIHRYLVLGALSWDYAQTYDGPLVHTVYTLPHIILTYIGHLIWPVNLSIAYNTSFITDPGSIRFLLPAGAIAALVTALIIKRKRLTREFWQAMALLFIPLLPVLNLGVLSQTYLIFDRYLYLSVAGWGYLIALAIVRLYEWERRRATADPGPSSARRGTGSLVVTAVVIILLAVGTVRENRVWADEYSLWSNAARIRPDFWDAHYNTGIALIDAGRHEEAVEVLLRAARLVPNEPSVLDTLGRAYRGKGDLERAVTSFKRSISIDPGMFESYNNLGTSYFEWGEYQLAEQQFLMTLRLNPNMVAARYNLALCYSRQGRYPLASSELEEVIRMNPDDALAHYELGLMFQKQARTKEAQRVLERGMVLADSAELRDRISEALRELNE